MELARLPATCIPDLLQFARIASIAQDIASLRSVTLHLIRKIFRSDSTIIWLTNQNNRIVDPLGVNVQNRFFPMYRDYYFRQNPLDPVNMGSFAGTSVPMEQVVPFNEFQKSEYYNDFIKPQKIRRQMAVYIHMNNKLTSVICTHRLDNTRFDEEDLTAADIVSSHMSAAFEKIHMIEQIKRKGNFFQMILDSTDVGIAALDLGKRPVFMNKKAISICAKIKKEAILKNELYSIESIIPPPVLNDCDAVEKCHKNDQKVGIDSLPMRERIMSISSFEKCLFRCRIVNRTMTDFNHPLFLITLEILPIHPKINEQAVKKDCNLTKRETEIVTYIFKGYRNAEIADRLFISEGTVKNHLRNIFEKAKVKTRTGLIHRVLSL
jgi:DNA-binding CsgD family transcriptional regulator